MPALPARIAFVTQSARSYVANDAAIVTRYGTAARDTKDEPVETFFESMSDVASIADARLVLLKADRRKFDIQANGVLAFTGGLDFTQVVPAASVIDTEKGAAGLACAIVAVEVDYETEATNLTVWG